MSAPAVPAGGASVLDRLQVLRFAPTPLRGAPAATWTQSPRTGVGQLPVPGTGLQPWLHDTTTTSTDPAGSTLATPDFGPKNGVHLTQAHRLPDREGPAPNYSLNDSRRISQFYGLHTSTGSSTSPLRTTPSLPKVGLFFMNFRELTRDPQPQVTGGREGTDAHNSVDRH